ncbi:hypothetical protein BO79DRAFT_13174 [Aspergillus costaricaensis CBS 115574]|uniref:Uncharacterized protein n=1 Tax=Aspergillus costaricaensis CBS 115574 TaxID=1448317 RepID=A0ACD1IFR1_9EURO|nr:hypothetical protein BO79DRAFT_13174 [Aspergillus costaricaensis CBS 115574]RAK89260.1 hypothetical protein BO79DRAFT_13174 [Aspergillus costaricaensis CBS 115574]
MEERLSRERHHKRSQTLHITESFRPLATSSAPGPREHKKVLVTGSLQPALWRCAIHLLPIIMSVTIVTINLNGKSPCAGDAFKLVECAAVTSMKPSHYCYQLCSLL